MNPSGMPSETELADAIANAARRAFGSLFRAHPGDYYYCSLTTTGEAHPPVVSAWSEEALSKVLKEAGIPDGEESSMRWSYADSPFYAYAEEFFEEVNRLFSVRPAITAALSNDEWGVEYELRLRAMERAMARLDSEGLFGTGRERSTLVVLVEVMPPDRTNVERATRLNRPGPALARWIAEAGEDQ